MAEVCPFFFGAWRPFFAAAGGAFAAWLSSTAEARRFERFPTDESETGSVAAWLSSTAVARRFDRCPTGKSGTALADRAREASSRRLIFAEGVVPRPLFRVG